MKDFIKWLIPWDEEMKWLLRALGFFTILLIAFILTGCESTLNWGNAFDQNTSQKIECYPKDATGCIGWAGNQGGYDE